MRTRTVVPTAAPSAPPGKTLTVLCLALLLALPGCSVMQLNAFEKHAARGEHAWIARQVVACDDASVACAQLHLMRGDACLRVAGAAARPAAALACAADALELGLSLNAAWPDPDERRWFQEKLCQSLKRLADLQSGPTAAQTAARLTEAAEGLYRLAPAGAGAVYYLAEARLRQVLPLSPDMTPAERLPVCNRLKRTLIGVLSMTQTARNRPPEDWDRFADAYQRLAFDLGTALRAAQCR